MLEERYHGVSIRYSVHLDGDNLGDFTGCDGLGCEVVMETREEGGNNSMVWQLPTRLKYPNVKLTRPLGKHPTQIADLFAKMATGYRYSNAAITAYDVEGAETITWGLLNVVPVRWTGPSLNPDQPRILTETLELAHQGFLPGRAG